MLINGDTTKTFNFITPIKPITPPNISMIIAVILAGVGLFFAYTFLFRKRRK